MTGRSLLEHLAAPAVWAAYVAQIRAGAAGQQEPKPPPFTIALSREVGARGTTVAREVGRRLGWAVYDHALLEEIARDMKLPVSWLESVDERQVSWLLGFMEAWSPGPMVSEAGYVHHLVETLLALAARGECVIVGRGAAQFLPPDTTLRVRLTARREDRVAVIRQELGLSQRAAEEHVANTDRERIAFVKEHFHKDPTDPGGYDLVLNTSRFSVEQGATLVVDALRFQQARAALARPQAAPV